jgi:hypothetical protein
MFFFPSNVCKRIAPNPVDDASTVKTYCPLGFENPITCAVHNADFKLLKLFCAFAGILPDFQSLIFFVRLITGVTVRLKFGIILLKYPMKALTSVIEVGNEIFCTASSLSFVGYIYPFLRSVET